MVKKMKKYLKFVVCCALILSLIAPSYAALSASDGSAFVTKAEFDSALADFNSRLTTFEAGINSKIDSQVTSYLDRNGIWNGKSVELLSNLGGKGFSWNPAGFWFTDNFVRRDQTSTHLYTVAATTKAWNWDGTPFTINDTDYFHETLSTGSLVRGWAIPALTANKSGMLVATVYYATPCARFDMMEGGRNVGKFWYSSWFDAASTDTTNLTAYFSTNGFYACGWPVWSSLNNSMNYNGVVYLSFGNETDSSGRMTNNGQQTIFAIDKFKIEGADDYFGHGTYGSYAVNLGLSVAPSAIAFKEFVEKGVTYYFSFDYQAIGNLMSYNPVGDKKAYFAWLPSSEASWSSAKCPTPRCLLQLRDVKIY